MTAEERMQERAAQVCDLVWQQSNSLAISRIAGQLAENIRALPLEGEQDQRAPIKYRAELIFDHETRIIHGTIDEPQGEPAEDQRGAAAIPTDTRAATVSDGAASKYRVEHDPSQSAPHHQRAERVKADARSVSQDDPASAHHSRTEQALVNAADGIDAVSQGRCKPAPAREPAVEEVNAAKKEGCFITAVGSYYQNVVGLDVALRHAGELDRLRAENAALREQLQGGVVVPRELLQQWADEMEHTLEFCESHNLRDASLKINARTIRAMLAAAKETKE